jgi:hypothetical protein
VHPLEFVFFDGFTAGGAFHIMIVLFESPFFTVMETEEQFPDVFVETSVDDEVVGFFLAFYVDAFH